MKAPVVTAYMGQQAPRCDVEDAVNGLWVWLKMLSNHLQLILFYEQCPDVTHLTLLCENSNSLRLQMFNCFDCSIVKHFEYTHDLMTRGQFYPRVKIDYELRVHDDVNKWKHFLRYWPFVWGIHRSPFTGEFPHKGQWRGALMFSLICAWTNGWMNTRDASDLRCHRTNHCNGLWEDSSPTMRIHLLLASRALIHTIWSPCGHPVWGLMPCGNEMQQGLISYRNSRT